MQPYDFTIKTQPNDAIMGGIQNAFSIDQMMQQREARQLQMQQAEQQMRAQEQQAAQDAYKRQRMQQVMRNPDSKSVLGLGIEFPELGKVFTDISANMQESEKASNVNMMQPLYLALKAGKPDAAVKIAENNIQAAKNAGDEKSLFALETLRDMIIAEPNVGRFMLTGTLAAAMGGKEFADFDKTTGEEARAQELQPYIKAEQQAKAADAARAKLAPAVQEAIDFANLTPDMKRVFQDLQILKKPPAPVTRVTVNNVENTAAAELGKLVPDLYTQANAASSHLAQIPRYRSAVDKAVTGPLANQRLGAARVASMLGFTGDKALSATGELVQGLAEMTLQSRTMLVGQGQITEKEQELLQKARSGDINMTATELKTILAVSERAAKAQYSQSRKLLESAATRSPTAGIFLENLKPESPEPSPSVSQPSVQPGMRLPGGFTVKSVGQ
jgi:hypothetical protein